MATSRGEMVRKCGNVPARSAGLAAIPSGGNALTPRDFGRRYKDATCELQLEKLPYRFRRGQRAGISVAIRIGARVLPQALALRIIPGLKFWTRRN